MNNNNGHKDLRTLKIHAEQVGLLYQSFTTSVIATLVGAVLLVSSQWSITEHTLLLGWLLIITTVTALRALLAYLYKRNPYDINESKRWGRLFTIGLVVAGATWGIGGVLLFPEDSLLYQVLMSFIIMAICSGAVTSISVMRGALLSFMVPALLPVVPLFIIEEADLSNFVAMMILLAFGFYIKASNNIYRSTEESINLRFSAEENEQKLHTKSEQLQNVISSAPLVLWSHDQNGIFTFSDGKGLDKIGLKSGEVVGQSVFELYAGYPNVINASRRALAGESFTSESLVGEYCYENHYIPHFDSQGKQNGCIGVSVDISERKKAATELTVAKEQAEKANLAKSDFLAHMSHELRTPMNAVLGFAQLLEMKLQNEDHKQCVKEIVNAGNHLMELVNDILDLSMIETGNLQCTLEDYNLNEMIKESILFIEPLATKHGIQIINDISSMSNYTLHVDNTRFKQVMINLLSNAVKYNRAKGTVTLNYNVIDENQLRINVIDTGNGLTEQEQQLLFIPFERIGEYKGIDGTGTGLAISKNLIELMNGSIGIESEIGKGSAFWIQVPIS